MHLVIDFGQARKPMVERQIVGRGLHDPVLLAAMKRVPREVFVPEHVRDAAYDDGALPIGEGQTISQPNIVAWMVEAAGVDRHDRVLEIGAGFGYAAAVPGEIAAHVDTIERHPALAESTRKTLAQLHCRNIDVHAGDGTLGRPQAAPYDVILASAGGPDVPAAWRKQLAIGGRLVMPVGMSRRRQASFPAGPSRQVAFRCCTSSCSSAAWSATSARSTGWNRNCTAIIWKRRCHNSTTHSCGWTKRCR